MIDLKGRHFAAGPPPDEKRQAATDQSLKIFRKFSSVDLMT